MIVAGNHIYEQCRDCRKMVRITGWFARLHLCLPPEQIAEKRRQEAEFRRMAKGQNQPASRYMSALGGGGGMRIYK